MPPRTDYHVLSSLALHEDDMRRKGDQLGYLRRRGAPWVTWHVLRHTCATLSDQAGLTVAEKQKLLGHATAAMSTHYTHPDMERMRLAWETVTGKPGKVN